MKLFRFLSTVAASALIYSAAGLHAQAIWNGTTINFTHAAAGGAEDQLTAGIKITRGSSGGLYNAVTEQSASGGSPADTQWAIGSLANYNTLSYGDCPLEQGNSPSQYVGTTFVVKLVAENIYLSLTLTAWGGQGGSPPMNFSYTRSTPSAAPPTPTVSITIPTNNTAFVAPASVTITANASVSSGTVTNVQFFTNNVSIGSVKTSPFTLTANNVAAGSYALTAVATAAGVSATSAVVNITVSSPTPPTPTVSITIPTNNAAFVAPASVAITANASVSGGTVTNVQFFTNNVSIGSVKTSPFTLTANNVAAGSYALTAVATAAGVSATSAVVNITVSSPAPPTPTVSLTIPTNGTVFAAPANVTITANASVSVGTVTNVQFYTNNVLVGSVQAAPFTLVKGLGAGTYTLTAVATAAGISATSAVVNVSVVNSAPLNISAAAINNGQFSFTYAANAGLSYVVQSSSNLLSWTPVSTNIAASGAVVFSSATTSTGAKYYRVGRLPNP